MKNAIKVKWDMAWIFMPTNFTMPIISDTEKKMPSDKISTNRQFLQKT
jgi:hypothetical protein